MPSREPATIPPSKDSHEASDFEPKIEVTRYVWDGDEHGWDDEDDELDFIDDRNRRER